MQASHQGAFYMVLAGVCFALTNAVTWTVTYKLGFRPQSDAFWQYLIAAVFSAPLIWRSGLAAMRTGMPRLHLLRVLLSVLGVQAFTMAFAAGLPPWHVVALVMTSPFFVILGARLFLRESVGANRWLATILGFAGAMILLRPWESGLTLSTLLPVAAAVCWGGASLITKRLTRSEPQIAITLWLLLLLSPVNLGFSVYAGFELPTLPVLGWLLAGGVLLFFAQHFLTKSYAVADAAFVQPFDDLKLFSNILVSWVVLGFVPDMTNWLGMLLIVAGSLYLLLSERAGTMSDPVPT